MTAGTMHTAHIALGQQSGPAHLCNILVGRPVSCKRARPLCVQALAEGLTPPILVFVSSKDRALQLHRCAPALHSCLRGWHLHHGSQPRQWQPTRLPPLCWAPADISNMRHVVSNIHSVTGSVFV